MAKYSMMTLAAALLGIQSAIPVQAQFVSDQPVVVTTVREALANGRHDQMTAFEGFILEQIKSKKYVFADDTGRIIAEIPDQVFRGQRVDPRTKIRIEGELELKYAKQETIDVFRLTVLRHEG